MLPYSSTIRTFVVLLTTLGMALPAVAVSPCRCSERDGSCAQASSPCCSSASKTCCSTANSPTTNCSAHASKPCCASSQAAQDNSPDNAPATEDCHHCPCCSQPATPAVATQERLQVPEDHDPNFLANTPLAASLPLNEQELCYWQHERSSPPGHPALRRHALKCVWLN